MNYQKLFVVVGLIITLFTCASVQAQVDNVDLLVLDQKVNEPGFILGNDTTFQGTLFAGWFDAVYLHQFGEVEPFEIDLEGNWNLYQTGDWTFSGYAGIFVLNMPAFHAAHELGLTTSYSVDENMTIGLYTAKFSSAVTRDQKGLLFKIFLCDQHTGDILVGRFNYGWKALIAYNDEYFFDNSGFSHIQGQAWVKYRATDKVTLTGHTGKQINLMDNFDDPGWFGISASYNF